MVDADGSLRWQARLWRMAAQRVALEARGLRYMAPLWTFARASRVLASLGPPLVFLGTGDFHHLAYHLIRRKAREPLTVLVFDRHLDGQPGIPGFVTCGSWLGKVVRLPRVRQVVVAAAEAAAEGQGAAAAPRSGDGSTGAKLLVVPPQRVVQVRGELPEEFSLLFPTRKVYVSIDKDVLREARTTWGSGPLVMSDLARWLSWLRRSRELVGADVCGELVPRSPWPDDREMLAIRTNEALNLLLYRVLAGLSVRAARGAGLISPRGRGRAAG